MAVPSLLPGGAPPAVTPGTTKTLLLLPGPAAKPFHSRATPCHEERSLCGRCVAGCRGRAPPRTRVVRRVHEASCQRGPTPRPSRAGEKAKGTARPRMFRRNPHGGRCAPTRPSCLQPCTQTRGWAGGLHVPRYPLRYRVSPARPRARSPAPCICPGHAHAAQHPSCHLDHGNDAPPNACATAGQSRGSLEKGSAGWGRSRAAPRYSHQGAEGCWS